MKGQVAVYCYQVCETGAPHSPKKVPIAPTKPLLIRDGRGLYSKYLVAEAVGYTLVEEDAHSGWDALKKEVFRHLQGCNRLFATNTGEIHEKFIQWIPGFQVFQKCLNGHSCSDKH